PTCKIIVLSGQNDEANARHARTLGALEFIAKPAQPAALREAVLRAAQLREQEHRSSNEEPALQRLIGESQPLTQVRERIRQYATASFPVLIEGESGVGKEVAAQALHELSPRAGAPFLALNCAAISPGLI